MELVKIEENKVTFSIAFGRCKTCSELMTKWHSPLSEYTVSDLSKVGVKIVKESYSDSGICIDCIKNGGFPRGCECCHKYKEFPKEFKYQLTKYAKYPEDETEFQYICTDCVRNNAQTVLFLAANYDEFSEIK